MPEISKSHCPAADQGSPSAHYPQYPLAAKGLAPGLPMYRVIPAGKAFYHVVETATNRVIGYRRQHTDACALARHLEGFAALDQTRIEANSGA